MAAQAAQFNAALARIGFSQEAITALNQNQITLSSTLIGMDNNDVDQLMKVLRGTNGAPGVMVPFLAQK
jgi:hypothetical protein